MTMFRWKLGALALAAAVAMTAAPAAAQGIYHRGNSGDPETLDPHKTSTVPEANIMRDIFETLVAFDNKAQLIPGIAESWTVSPDGVVYTFKLRANAKWSNGDPLVASDVVFSQRRLQDPATGAKYATVLYPVKNAEKVNKGQLKPEELGVRAVDDRTVEFTLEAPTPYFLQLLTHQTGAPVHPATVQKHGKDWVKVENIVTNGAFKVKEVVPASHIRVEKNPHFHDAANVKLDGVMFYPTEDRSAALRRFQAGELHSNDDVPTEQIAFIRKTFGNQFTVAPYLGTYYFSFNTTKPPLNDVRVRQALSMVVDREFLAEDIWGGTMVPAYSFVPPGINNYEGGPAVATWKDKTPIEREEMALKLLKEAGYGPGLKPMKFEIRFNTSENHKKTSVALADMWKPLGVEVTYVNTDLKTHYAHLRDGGDYDIARAAWIADYSDPQNFLFLLESGNTGFNYARYKNAEYDALMAAASKQIDLKKRAAILKDAETMFMRDLPFLPLLFYGSKNLVSDKLVGRNVNILDIHPSRFLSLK